MKELTLRRYMLYTIALLVPCFAVWSYFGPLLGSPSVLATNYLLQLWTPEAVEYFQIIDGNAVLMTRHYTDGEQLGFAINTRIYSYSIPFFAALHFALPQDNSLERFFRGMVVLWLCLIFSLVFVCMKQMMVNLGPEFYEMTAAPLPPPLAIALLYQFGSLMIPPLVPVLLWAWEVRTHPSAQDWFGKLMPAPPADTQSDKA